ncbi:helix-turn-helix transcriptional regulator [Oceanibium sediminis]|uniref:helix-turn-helix transcriptional regulator n=1 Tax=Oceanibium sediminis TaxID=2026339 RepID=UPI001E65242A|nr:helix-turn-helix transcriptional regulator [Oceanibium sediminis]
MISAGHETGSTVDAIYDILTGGGSIQTCLDAVRDATGARSVIFEHRPRGARDRRRFVACAMHGTPCDSDLRIEGGVSADSADEDGTYRLHLVAPKGGLMPGVGETLPMLLRHLRRALRLAARLDRTDLECTVYSSALDRLAIGAIFLDAEGRIVHETPLARALIDAGDGLRRVRGGLAACGGSADRSLQTAIRSALGLGGQPVTEQHTMVVARASGLRDLGVIVRRTKAGGDSAGGVGAVVMIRDADSGGTPDKDILRCLFDMTPAEADVARSLTAGLSLDETAEELGISRNTARAHLRSIFAKSGIRRQTELVRLMLSSAAMLSATPRAMDAA